MDDQGTTSNAPNGDDNNNNNNNITTSNSSSQVLKGLENSATTFLDWLPTWFEAVIALLREERRRTLTLFGSKLAPEIIAKVLNECFRPILPSFKSRLAIIYSPKIQDMDPAVSKSNHFIKNNKSTTNGSLESICNAYQATLQFLSVAYEQMVEMESSSNTNINMELTIHSSKNTQNHKSQKNSSNHMNKTIPSPSPTLTSMQLFLTIRSIFSIIVSPFTPYQSNYAILESKHSLLSSQLIARDVQNAVTVRVTSVSVVEESIERLGTLAPFIFSIAQGAMARFELLNCGYEAHKALSSIDSLLSMHISEISSAIHTLSATISASFATGPFKHNQNHNHNNNLDEQLVQVTLELLKVAGSFRHELNSFEDRTRDRLRLLSGLMGAAIEMDRSFALECKTPRQDHLCTSNISPGSISTLLLPDSLSTVELQALLAKDVCTRGKVMDADCSDKEDKEEDDGEGTHDICKAAFLDSSTKLTNSQSVSTLLQLTDIIESDPKLSIDLYPKASMAFSLMKKACHTIVFEVCATIPLKNLSEMSNLTVWRQTSATGGTGSGVGIEEIHADDSYGMLPQSYITLVGEDILALVQALEPFASNHDALQLAQSVMDDVEEVAIQPWKDFANACNCDRHEEYGDKLQQEEKETIILEASGRSPSSSSQLFALLMDGKAIIPHVLNDNDPILDDDTEDASGSDSAGFCNQWLNVVCTAVTGRLLERIMRIHHLSPKGSEHLVVDMNYLINVLTALGVSGHPHPLLSHMAKIMKMDDETLQNRIMNHEKDSLDKMATVVYNAELRVLLMRGITI
mmetsp:Transcript_5353/g.7801  ORF Transcript_5353/g.7801 Transcript_5353/m.7801 type:complete len:802 (+) Transcript_5353:54-2459(+)